MRKVRTVVLPHSVVVETDQEADRHIVFVFDHHKEGRNPGKEFELLRIHFANGWDVLFVDPKNCFGIT